LIEKKDRKYGLKKKTYFIKTRLFALRHN